MSRFTKKSELSGLVITSKEGEQIFINSGELKIEVVEIRGKTVRLAFQASSEISIRRKKALQNCNDSADTSQTQDV